MRLVLVAGIVIAFVVGLFVLGDVEALRAETIQLKLAHFMPPKHIQHVKSFVPFSQKVEEFSEGKVMIKVFSGGSLGGPKQLADAAKRGITDIAFVIPAYVTGRFPRYSALDLPFVAETAEEATKIIYDMYDQYLAEDFKDYKVLWLYSCGGGQIITRNTSVRTAEDLKGMKVRAPSAYMSKSLRLLGSNPVGMPIAELAVSLQKGVIDGMLGPYSSIPDFRLAGLVKYVTEMNLYVIPMAVLMNKKRWDSLPDFAKKAIDQASGRQWGLHAARIYDKQDADAVREIEKTNKIKIYRMSEDEIGKIRGILKPLEKDWVETMSKKGIPSKAILEATYSTRAKRK